MSIPCGRKVNKSFTNKSSGRSGKLTFGKGPLSKSKRACVASHEPLFKSIHRRHGKLSRGILFVDGSLAVFLEQQNLITIAPATRFHSRRTERHAGHGQAFRLRTLFQKAQDLRCWNVTL